MSVKSLILFFLISTQLMFAQKNTDSIAVSTIASTPTLNKIIVPTALISLGLIALDSNIKQNQKEIYSHNFVDFKTTADNYLQFAPAVLSLGLNITNIESRSEIKDQVAIMAMTHLIGLSTVYGLKKITDINRPDGTEQAFPSGHTAEAFIGASILAKEYGGNGILIPILGYGIATSVGMLRMTNNKHWLSDVLVGAGVGIASTEISYLIYPWLKRKLFAKKSVTFYPSYRESKMGVACTIDL